MILIVASFGGFGMFVIPVFILCFLISFIILRRHFKNMFSNNVSISKEMIKIYIKKLIIVYIIILIVFFIIITLGIIRQYDFDNSISKNDNLLIKIIKNFISSENMINNILLILPLFFPIACIFYYAFRIFEKIKNNNKKSIICYLVGFIFMVLISIIYINLIIRAYFV